MKLSTKKKKLHIMKIKICDHVKAFVFSLFIQRSYKAEGQERGAGHLLRADQGGAPQPSPPPPPTPGHPLQPGTKKSVICPDVKF